MITPSPPQAFLGPSHLSRQKPLFRVRNNLEPELADIFLGGLGGAIEQAMGIAKNPCMTIDLNSQNFKEHNFLWKFSPQTSAESQTLRQIINTLKNYSLPSLNSSPYFLNYPAMVLPMYIPNQAQLYEFKFCLISSVTVDWNSAGTAAFYTGTQAPWRYPWP